MELSLLQGIKDENVKTKLILDSSNNVIGINQSQWVIYNYRYNMHMMQERYILITFENRNITINNLH
tara:strand:+ start:231 stop:431 length:201 start_codon:yes stop_codon:yes gene_type:complete